MADAYAQSQQQIETAFASLPKVVAEQIVKSVLGSDNVATFKAVTTIDSTTLNAAATEKVEILQVSGGGNFNLNNVPSTLKVLVFTEPVVINGTTYSGTVLLGPGNDSANFSLTQVASGSSEGVTIDPGAGSNTVVGSAGADKVYVGAGAKDTVDGGAGVDKLIISGKQSAFTFKIDGNKVIAENTATGTRVEATNSELFQFDDGVVVNAANSGEAAVARLYEVLLNRSPDAEGMKYWLEVARSGKLNIVEAAQGFIGSAESQAKGVATMTDSQFLDLLYSQAFGRAADDGGKAYWLDKMAHGVTHDSVAIYFAESTEASVVVTGVNTITGSV